MSWELISEVSSIVLLFAFYFLVCLVELEASWGRVIAVYSLLPVCIVLMLLGT